MDSWRQSPFWIHICLNNTIYSITKQTNCWISLCDKSLHARTERKGTHMPVRNARGATRQYGKQKPHTLERNAKGPTRRNGTRGDPHARTEREGTHTPEQNARGPTRQNGTLGDPQARTERKRTHTLERNAKGPTSQNGTQGNPHARTDITI